ncbi:RnfABCDGE type electron transport complex subunit D [Candidatus Marithrix sp. Canyon 246]|uniref:RnfABCDGE type electron transport complex subunit D n=1 Tax=Candidatus Marithrix sp. Canyon 246 TaxID=1827136 RepID=UPI000AF3DE3C|nr:RnfABCDGE type electron transport complex subunit D [Candidatus Marithrix sp. Canyon 246]
MAFAVLLMNMAAPTIEQALIYLFAYQRSKTLEFVEADCFQHTTPIKVPARTFLS